MYKIAKENLPQLYRRIAEKKELYLPLEIGGQTNFAVWEEGDTVALDVLKTVKSPKDAFFPQSENLYTCKREGKKISIEPQALKEQDYVQAATALGASTGRIIVKHLLPNTLGIIMVDITMSVPGFIFSEAFLSYIGLGVRPPETSWGALASAGQQQLMFYPHELFFPCLMIVLTMLTFHLIGDGLSDALDPKLRK